MFGQKPFGSSSGGFGTFGSTPNANPFGTTTTFGQTQQPQQQAGFGAFGSNTTQTSNFLLTLPKTFDFIE